MASDPAELPSRLNVAEVCALAGGSTPISIATLDRRIAQGRLPRPIDRGRTRLFDRDAVLSALGMVSRPSPQVDRSITPEQIRAARQAQRRR